MGAIRYPLSKRFNVALSATAYAKLRNLNQKYHYGNNYLLTILLENIDTLADSDALDKVFAAFKEEYGAPAPGDMNKPQD